MKQIYVKSNYIQTFYFFSCYYQTNYLDLYRISNGKKMKLTPTTRWVGTKQDPQTKELTHGMEIEYYGNSVKNCDYGIIKEVDGIFSIEWENITTDTVIDGSDKSNAILKDCGFGI